MTNKTYKYLLAGNVYLEVEASVTEARTSSLMRAAEDDYEPCDAECNIESIKLNGLDFEVDDMAMHCGFDIFKKPIWRDLHTVICDAILEGSCDHA